MSRRGVSYDRKLIYQFLADNADSNNNLMLSQNEVSELLGIQRHYTSRMFSEFVSLGLLDKQGHTFTLLYEPDAVPWDKYEILRKKYTDFTIRNKMEQSNE